MEFVIEEMGNDAQKAQTRAVSGAVFSRICSPFRQLLKQFCTLILAVFAFIRSLPLYARLREGLQIQRWSLKQEGLVMLVIASIVILGLIGSDLFHNRAQRQVMLQAQRTIGDLTQVQRTLQVEMQPVIALLQADWLKQQGGDLLPFTELLLQLKSYFGARLQLITIEKKHTHALFEIKGRVVGFEGVFQLEQFLQTRGWFAEITFEDQGAQEKRFTMKISAMSDGFDPSGRVLEKRAERE